MGCLGLVGSGGPGECSKHNGLDRLAYPFVCMQRKPPSIVLVSSKRLVSRPGACFCLFSGMGDGKRRRDWQDWPCAVCGKIELKMRRHSPNLMHSGSSGCLCWSGRTGPREHPGTVWHHDAIEKDQARVVVAGHAVRASQEHPLVPMRHVRLAQREQRTPLGKKAEESSGNDVRSIRACLLG
jgi:hypothetical protein